MSNGSAYIQRADGSFLFFDLTEEEGHEGTVITTDFPVEEGADITDHVRVQLTRLRLQVFVSNAPLFDLNGHGGSQDMVPVNVTQYKAPFTLTPGAVFGAVGGALTSAVDFLLGNETPPLVSSVLRFATEFDAVQETQEALTEMQGTPDGAQPAELIKVITSRYMYENMILEHFDLVRNAETGTGAEASLTFKQMRFAEVTTTDTPQPTEARGQAPATKGAKGAKPAKPGPKAAVDLKLAQFFGLAQ